MKNIILVSVLFLTSLAFSQDNVTKELGDFHEVKAYDGLSITIKKGDKNKAVISGKNSSEVIFVNKNGKLKVRMNINEVFNGYKTFVVLYAKDLIDVIDVNENAFVTVKDNIEQIDLELRAQEGAKIEGDIKVDRLKSKAVTGGVITLTGVAKNQEVDVNTGGRFEGSELISEQTDVDVKAGGIADVHATQFVDAKVKVGGTINVSGKPKVIEKQTFVGGTINEE
ncbi:DUF2807 domain-containing protein [Joostella atrarenae]|uniref:DUF2807 domain-containing protein n=1 Tax=Joostella atrarenae TaxID=679257 RepID=A0ABS9IZL6_9FLAO|nr:head GIN domain-containing protein [Joostella atrarenae]MCF8713607.1 DUF2807 domain-containing protein [Joostella atrarenae]